MLNVACPRILIAGVESGVGKTSLSLGLARALSRRPSTSSGQGLRVQCFKVGPDFLDPTYLALAGSPNAMNCVWGPPSGRTCYNLDGWMCGREYVERLFARACADADLAVIEGVMGLFDGASPSTLEGSSAEIAQWLQAPTLLVVNAHGAARSLAATVKGFAEFEPGVRLAGVIANRVGSDTHRQWLSQALGAAKLPPLLGAVPRDALAELHRRHLGLVTADAHSVRPEAIEQLADACEKHLDLDAILALAQAAAPLNLAPEEALAPRAHEKVRIGVARDSAFHFYYPDNLEAMQRLGAELVGFSPIADGRLPADLDGLYLGGGYPEVHAEALSANKSMRADVRAFAESGRAVYAECGGLMYLTSEVETGAGVFPMAGVLPARARMLERLKSIGYAEVTLTEDSLWGRSGARLRGHEFHYSELCDSPLRDGWRTVYSLRRRSGRSADAEGFQKGRVLASYVHLHFASRPEAVERFLAGLCPGGAGGRKTS